MSETLKRIAELERQRATLNADIDREIESLKLKAMQELESLKSQLAGFETILHITPEPGYTPTFTQDAPPPQPPPQQPADPWAETDAGRGGRFVAVREDGVSFDEFKDELAELRERGVAKRRRIA